MHKNLYRIIIFITISLSSCSKHTYGYKKDDGQTTDSIIQMDSISVEVKKFTRNDIHLTKSLTYDKYTLEDTYPYKDTTRVFQWDKIKELLFLLDSIQLNPENWGILENYKNKNGEAKLTKAFFRDEYKKISDTLNVQRYQSIPLYSISDSITPIIYGRDGSLIKYKNDSSNFLILEVLNHPGQWMTERKYIRNIEDSIKFNHAIFVDRKNQNISTLEKIDSIWYIRSMNPTTTGLHRPPMQQETPIGMFVLQEKKAKMYYYKDGTTDIGGFAPWANRFTNGAYIHGVPVNVPQKSLIEYSYTLGTTPKSHMCVRSVTSHSKFIFDNFPIHGTIIFVLE